MATVTVYTAARMKEIEDSAIIDGDVVGDDLILTRYDTAQINAGSVRGVQGVKGDTGLAGPPAVVTSTTRPVNPTVGMIIYETDTKNLYTWNGTTWALPNNVPKLNRNFVARRTNDYSIASDGVFKNVPLDIVDEATLGAGSWNGTTITLGASGLYSVSWGIMWASNSNGVRGGHILHNPGDSWLGPSEVRPEGVCSISGSTIRRMNSGDTLTLRAIQLSGVTLNIHAFNKRTYLAVSPLF